MTSTRRVPRRARAEDPLRRIVQRKACYLALAIDMDGEREVLGMWFQANDGAKFWTQVLTDLK